MRGAWLGVVAVVASACVSAGEGEGISSGSAKGRVPASTAAVGGVSVGPPADCSSRSLGVIDSSRSFAVIDAGPEWSCVVDACRAQVTACASDCACNFEFTQVLDCAAVSGLTSLCFTPALGVRGVPVNDLLRCIGLQQKACTFVPDAGAIDVGEVDASAALASELDAAAAATDAPATDAGVAPGDSGAVDAGFE